MKIVLDIPDNKVGFMMELLRSLSFVKAKPLPVGISNEKALFLAELGEAVEELNDVLSGKAQARDAYKLLDELWTETAADLRPASQAISQEISIAENGFANVVWLP